ncbi:VWA domain-containing protein, partial [Vibrio sp. 10N.286.49.B3]|uniref:VWA domain-containing protein n=1 Tax=Vibrio sp. 10N.286.49.B3 TaxID=1880855 RepID=UPI0010568A04
IPTTQDDVYEGDETFGLVVTEANDITTNGDPGVTGQATIIDDELPPTAPVVGTATASVSEEGLSNAIADETDKGASGDKDTTDEVTFSGTIAISDVNDNIDTVELVLPSNPSSLTSNGVGIIWSQSDSQTLIGKAGSETIVEITIDDAGAYDVTLSGPVDHTDGDNVEDIVSLNIGVKVTDDTNLSTTGTLSINIEDDSPDAAEISHDVAAETKEGANVQLILDVSGSMGNNAGNGKSRLQVMKESSIQLLREYESIGQTKVQVIKFSSSASVFGSSTTVWMSVDSAISYINGLSAGGVTDYDHAVSVAEDNWNVNDADKIVNGSNVSYFLSDGVPVGSDNGNSNAINSTEQEAWETHLKDNDVTALAYGIGVNVPASDLATVAYDGLTEQNIDPVIVPDVTQLPPVLLQSVLQPVGGNLLNDQVGGDVTGIGADGGVVKSITLGGLTVTFDGDDSVSQSGSESDVTYAFDSSTNTLSIYIDEQHSFVVDMDDGGYSFFGASGRLSQEYDFGYTLIDNDGDTSSSNVVFTIDPNKVYADVISSTDIVDTVTVSAAGQVVWQPTGQTGETFSLVDSQAGLAIDVGSAADNVHVSSGDDAIFLGDSNSAQDSNNTAETLLNSYAVGKDSDFLVNPNDETSAFNINTNTAYADLAHGGAGDDTIFGEEGTDIIFGSSGDDKLDGGEGDDGLRGGTGDDVLIGGAGDDILIGGLGDDILTGGDDDNLFKWVDASLDDGTDVITDFTDGEDKIDLSELLADTNSNDMNDLLANISVEVDGDNINLIIPHDNDTQSQTIVLKNGATEFSSYVDASSGEITSVTNFLNDIMVNNTP